MVPTPATRPAADVKMINEEEKKEDPQQSQIQDKALLHLNNIMTTDIPGGPDAQM